MIVQLRGNLREVGNRNAEDIVIEEHDLFPAHQPCQQQAQVALQAQVTVAPCLETRERGIRGLKGQDVVPVVIRNTSDQSTATLNGGHPLRCLDHIARTARQDHQQDVSRGRQFSNRLQFIGFAPCGDNKGL